MSLRDKSLYIMTPMYGAMCTNNYHVSFHKLSHLCRELGVGFEAQNVINESLITRARNRLVDIFIKESSATHACFIDADIGFDPQDIIAMLEVDKPLLGVACSKKAIRWDHVQTAVARRVLEWVAQAQPQGHPHEVAAKFIASGKAFQPADFPRIAGDLVLNFEKWNGDKVIDFAIPEPAQHIGTGLLMVKREVFLKFMKAYPDRWYEAKADPASNPGRIFDFFKTGVNPETREYLSEDFWFVRDCAAIGYQPLLAPWVRTTHMGTYSFEGDMPAILACAGTLW